MNLAPPSGSGVEPRACPAPLTQPPSCRRGRPPPAVPPPVASTAGQAVLSLTARYGKDLPVINSGLVWRVFADRPDESGTFKLIREERGATPNIVLPPGSYVVHVALGLVSAVRPVTLEVRDRPRILRAAGRRPAHRRPRRHQQDSAEPDLVRDLQGQPVRGRRARLAGAERRGRRRRAAAGGHLLHHLQLRRRQFGGALGYPRSGRQADRRHHHPSRRGDHAETGQRQGRRGAGQHRVVGDHAGRRRHQGIDRRVSRASCCPKANTAPSPRTRARCSSAPSTSSTASTAKSRSSRARLDIFKRSG